jgi:hypothetical protein
MQCAAHPGTETVLRCGKCDTPICPRCTVHTPVGARCRKCTSNRSSPLYRASPLQYLLASLASLAASLLLGWLPTLFMLLGPVAYGWAVGEATLRAGGRRRGLGMQVISGVAAAIGILFWILGGPEHFGQALSGLSPGMFFQLIARPFTLIGLVLGVGCAAAHVRYI